MGLHEWNREIALLFCVPGTIQERPGNAALPNLLHLSIAPHLPDGLRLRQRVVAVAPDNQIALSRPQGPLHVKRLCACQLAPDESMMQVDTNQRPLRVALPPVEVEHQPTTVAERELVAP